MHAHIKLHSKSVPLQIYVHAMVKILTIYAHVKLCPKSFLFAQNILFPL